MYISLKKDKLKIGKSICQFSNFILVLRDLRAPRGLPGSGRQGETETGERRGGEGRESVSVCHHGLDSDQTDDQADHQTSHPAHLSTASRDLASTNRLKHNSLCPIIKHQEGENHWTPLCYNVIYCRYSIVDILEICV